ncbi:MAG: nucleotidyl transferase AbiEii/AbiGii toxin family protein [Gammaproteobacteria bacterium]|nr:nucleotidyl transferase AbiEii/AbiGii toxin family protein [Gammaproteobacteria bacterium]
MDKVARWAERERKELFTETAAVIRSTAAIVEKDFWVSWVLKQIYENEVLAPLFMFKGGTSLSKVYGLINRFSEDIDLVLDWRTLSGESPLEMRSNTARDKYNKALLLAAETYTSKVILPALTSVVAGVCDADLLEPRAIRLRYPASFSDKYVLPAIKLEIGPLSAWDPWEEKQISCYAAQAFPHVFQQTHCNVKVISAKRTFWDKATILHHEANRPAGSTQPRNYSRHYYELAQPGSFKLLPPMHVMVVVENDYHAMRGMFFGEVPALERIMATLQALEDEINQFGLSGRDVSNLRHPLTPYSSSTSLPPPHPPWPH